MPQPLPTVIDRPSARAQTIARWFGLARNFNRKSKVENRKSPTLPLLPACALAGHAALGQLPLPAPGQIILITGPSGSGKSTLLRLYRRWIGPGHFLDLPAIRLKPRPIIDLFPRLSLEDALELLSRVGLAEAHSYLRPPLQLSDGQRWRLRLALALERAQHSRPATVDGSSATSSGCHGRLARPCPPRADAGGGQPVTHRADCALRNEPNQRQLTILCDEFASLLDPVTAAVVAHALRKTVSRSPNLSAILATSRDDLARALRPEVIVTCNFGQIHVQHVTCPREETHAARSAITA